MCLPPPPPRAPLVPRLLRMLVACALACLCAATALQAQVQMLPVHRADPVLPVATWRGQQVVAGELLVQFRAGTPPAAQAQRHTAIGAARLSALTDTLQRVALPAGADIDALIASYQTSPDVVFAQPNVLHRPIGAPPAGLVPSDPKWSQQWHLKQVHAPDGWTVSTGDAAAVVAIIDSGVDVDHPDLDGHLAWGLDTFAGDADPDDAFGHGTHCAGIAAAETDNGVGVAGAGFACRFAAYRCGNSSFPTSALVAAINDAVARGALVLSMSWGSYYNDPAIRTALQAARDAGCVLVAAAGNDGLSTKFYPAAHDFVIAVAASTNADARASFSNYGAWVDVAAPGQNLYSTYKGGGYTTMSGTSMACPLVAGMADLLYARLGGTRSPAHAALVRAALESSAVDVGAFVVHGRVDLAAALGALVLPSQPAIVALVPATVQAFHGSVVTVMGTGFSTVSAVTVDGVPALSFTATDDHTLAVTLPDAPALGPGTLTVHGPGGTLASAPIAWIATDPPRLEIPATVPGGAVTSWAFGGGAQHAWVLFIALDAATFPWQGWQILEHFVLLASGSLDGRGLGALPIVVPASAIGVTFHSQLATFQGGVAGVSTIATTTIVP